MIGKQVTRLVGFARRQRPDLHIIARAHDRTHVYELYQAGANDIVREMFDSSLRAGRYVLENIGLSEYEAAQAEQTFYHHDRTSVRELAELVDSGNADGREQKVHRACAATGKGSGNGACWNWPKNTPRNPPDRAAARVRRLVQPSETPASAKVAMPEWQATALLRMLIARLRPSLRPDRRPRLSRGSLPSFASMAPCAPSALW